MVLRSLRILHTQLDDAGSDLTMTEIFRWRGAGRKPTADHWW